ncbi:hypothetical protein A2U01_0076482, partial [Trifolium medium]|nr:hypothetical protein [Trifolium medium]
MKLAVVVTSQIYRRPAVSTEVVASHGDGCSTIVEVLSRFDQSLAILTDVIPVRVDQVASVR